MTVLDSLPAPEAVARRLAAARRERNLLRRLYRLALDAKTVSEHEENAGSERPHCATTDANGGAP